MTWSLRLYHGDLQKSGSQLAKVSNETKMVQDLRCQFLYQMGIDDLHPDFGSLLDGGKTPDGVIRDSLIGMDDKEYAKALLYSEIQRVISDYQERQLARAKLDKLVYGKATLTRNEVVQAVESIDIVENLDGLQVNITIQTGSNKLQNITLSVSNS